MEELLKQVLSEIKDLKVGQERTNQRLDTMDLRFDNIDSRLDNMDLRFDNMESRLDNMDLRLDNMESRLDNMDLRLDNMESSMATKFDIARLESKIEQYGEVQQKDVYHLLELTSKKVDAIHEDITAKFEVLNSRLFRQEAAVQQLKAVK